MTTTFPIASEPNLSERFVACLLGGAIGDALGAPVEFLSWPEIRKRFGPNGIRSFASAYGGTGMITHDTQMTLFTAEGLIRAEHRLADRGIANVDGVLRRAYLRWLYTQVGDPRRVESPWFDGASKQPRAIHLTEPAMQWATDLPRPIEPCIGSATYRPRHRDCAGDCGIIGQIS